MLEWFTDSTGRQRLVAGLILLAVNVLLLLLAGIVWFWLWAVTVALLLFSSFRKSEDE